MFLGGLFYSADPYVMPCHISYMSATDWGIADSTGADVGTIRFNGAHGDIYTPAGAYAGCLKGRSSLFNNGDDVPADLAVFLNSITGVHQLDIDSLLWDINYCSYIGEENPSTAYTSIRIPEDGILAIDGMGRYYITAVEGDDAADAPSFLQALVVSGDLGGGTTLTGNHVALIPDTRKVSGSSDILTDDFIISVKGDSVIIGKRGSYGGRE